MTATNKRIGNQHREMAAARLGTAFREGFLDVIEYEERLELAYAAKFESDLKQLFTDLPSDPVPMTIVVQPVTEVVRAPASRYNRPPTWVDSVYWPPIAPWRVGTIDDPLFMLPLGASIAAALFWISIWLGMDQFFLGEAIVGMAVAAFLVTCLITMMYVPYRYGRWVAWRCRNASRLPRTFAAAAFLPVVVACGLFAGLLYWGWIVGIIGAVIAAASYTGTVVKQRFIMD